MVGAPDARKDLVAKAHYKSVKDNNAQHVYKILQSITKQHFVCGTEV